MGRISDWSSSGTLNSSSLFLSVNDERGITLVGLLLGLTLALLMIGILQQLTSLIFYGYMNSSNRAELQFSSRIALDWIQQDIRSAQDFQVSADGSQLTISSATGVDIHIYVNNGNLYRKKVSSLPIAENFSNVNFIKSGSRLQGKLQLHKQENDYEVDFLCFSRAMKAQE